MRSNAETQIQAYQQELEKFRARWDQLKPSNDVIESGDQEALQKCVQTIKEKKAEFDELESTRQKLMCVPCSFMLFDPCFVHFPFDLAK